MEPRAWMQLQPVLRRLILVDVEIVEDHVQVLLGEGFDNILEKRRKLTEVRRCLT